MDSAEIRESFLRFFEERGHLRMPSAPLVPHGDPTLLFTTAGMVPFKPYFMGQAQPPSRRLTSVQKSFRTTDIDEVGDTSHLTFFEMLGNFSIGDYFKNEAIAYAWEFVTQVLRLPPERLWATVFLDDDEAIQRWQEIGIPPERIRRYGEEDNFWFSGDIGPCGPCSEIHYDFGYEYGCGDACEPSHKCGRFLEIWNLVFMTYYQQEDGSRTPLPSKNIDTGAGLERVTVVMKMLELERAGQKPPRPLSVYDTDIFQPVVRRIEELSSRQYGQDEQTDRAMRVVAEHARSATFLIGDGVIPSNEGRGYVLRRVLRRGLYFAQRIGLSGERPFLADVAGVVINKMGEFYSDLRQQREFILRVMQVEEERFANTLAAGRGVLADLLEGLQPGDVLPGSDIFVLYDTYGFPREVTAEIAAERGVTLDNEGFEREMEKQRERARAAARFEVRRGEVDDILAKLKQEQPGLETRFVGYDTTRHESSVIALIAGGGPLERAEADQEVYILLRETPFYPEGGGQVGDTGEIVAATGRAIVEDTQRMQGLIVHRARVAEGHIDLNDPVTAAVDEQRRRDTMRNHTATHLLHAALRQVLGPHVRQAGSLVAPDRLRFDFTHIEAVKPDELARVQHLVNEKIRENRPVTVRYTQYTRAMEEGVLAFFDETYGEEVRVVEVAENSHRFSAELCGGTHCHATGDIGFVYIIGESSIGAGMRRIEAVTGRGAEAYIERQVGLLESLAQRLGTTIADLDRRVAALQEELEAERRRAEALEREASRRIAERLIEQAERVDSASVVAAQVSVSGVDMLREIGDHLRDRLGSAVVVLGAVVKERPSFVAMVTPDLVNRGLHAGEIIRQVAAVTGGGGGGRPNMAQAGGRDASRLSEALDLVPRLVRQNLEGRAGD